MVMHYITLLHWFVVIAMRHPLACFFCLQKVGVFVLVAPSMMRSKDRGRSSYDRYEEEDYDHRRRGRSYSRSPRRSVYFIIYYCC